MNEQTEQQIDKMKEALCAWPGCKEKNMTHVALPVLKETPNGMVPSEEMKDMQVPIPLCNYHFGISQAGLCGVVQNPNVKGSFGFVAPVDAVNVSEAVINSMVFSGKLKTLIDLKSESDKKLKDMEKELEKKNEHEPNNKKPEGNEPSDKSSDKQCS